MQSERLGGEEAFHFGVVEAVAVRECGGFKHAIAAARDRTQSNDALLLTRFG